MLIHNATTLFKVIRNYIYNLALLCCNRILKTTYQNNLHNNIHYETTIIKNYANKVIIVYMNDYILFNAAKIIICVAVDV